MGAGAGKFVPFERQDSIEGQGKLVLLAARNIKLKNLELDRIYHEFHKNESIHDHKMDLFAVIEKYKIKLGIFAKYYFEILDEEKTGNVNFLEYLILTWGLLSTDDDGLASLCCVVFDTEGSGSLDNAEVNFMVNTIWDFKPPDEVLMALKHLNKNVDGFMTTAEFALLCRHYPFILSPIRKVREKLKKKIIFKRFWEELKTRRIEDHGYNNLFDILTKKVLKISHVKISLEYLSLESTTPLSIRQQWQLSMKRKGQCRKGKVEIPHEFMEPQESKFIEDDLDKYKSIRPAIRDILNPDSFSIVGSL